MISSKGGTAEVETIPLCVDLDRTLIRTNLQWETFWFAIQRKPFLLIKFLFGLFRGRKLTREIGTRFEFLNIETLPYNNALLHYVKEVRATGRRVYIIDRNNAASGLVAKLGCIDGVIVPQGGDLLTEIRRTLLSDGFGGEFEYAGNGRGDLHLWGKAKAGVLVNPPRSFLQSILKSGVSVSVLIEERPSVTRSVLYQIRVHQWVKNLLVFVPVFLAHRFGEPDMLVCSLRAFIPFCLVASAVYVWNDLLDLESDRQHPVRRWRPFAAGDLPLWSGLLLGPVMALTGLALAAALALPFFAILGLYLLATFYYSFWGKRKIIIDVMLLSGLYSIRLYAGGIATHITISTWTLAYTSFLFLSLALLKRYSELLSCNTVPTGRGYRPGDAPVLGMLGCASGLLAALPLALYAGSPEVLVLYKSPHLLWLLGAVQIYGVSRLWLLANRGDLSGDPVVFAIRDPATYLLILLSCTILALSI